MLINSTDDIGRSISVDSDLEKVCLKFRSLHPEYFHEADEAAVDTGGSDVDTCIASSY